MANGSVLIDSNIAEADDSDWVEFKMFRALADVLSEWEERINERVRAVWPVDTGYSLSRWRVRTWMDKRKIVLTVRNDADYAGFVRIKGTQDLVVYEEVVPVLDELLPAMRDAVDTVLLTEKERRRRKLPQTAKTAGSPRTTSPAPPPSFPGATRIRLRPPGGP